MSIHIRLECDCCGDEVDQSDATIYCEGCNEDLTEVDCCECGKSMDKDDDHYCSTCLKKYEEKAKTAFEEGRKAGLAEAVVALTSLLEKNSDVQHKDGSND